MKTRTIVLAAALALGFSGGAAAADAAAGADKAKPCLKCHEADEYAGTPAADIESKIKAIVAGTTKHKNKLTLAEADIQDIAAFFAAGK